MIMPITITSIDYSDPNCSTDVVDLVKLSNGKTLLIGNGKASYNIYDDYTGTLVAGAKLVGSTDEDDHTVYHFESK